MKYFNVRVSCMIAIILTALCPAAAVRAAALPARTVGVPTAHRLRAQPAMPKVLGSVRFAAGAGQAPTVVTHRMAAATGPETAANGITLGSVTVVYNSGTLEIEADVNNDSGSPQTLYLQAWATYEPWEYAPLGYILATSSRFQVPAEETDSVDTGLLAYSAAPEGCYYITVVLLDNQNLQEDNSPQQSGGEFTFSFGGASCPVNTSPYTCFESATTACILNARFAVEVYFRDAFDNGTPTTIASVKPVTGFANAAFETAFFYFNDVNNIELLVKMLDQGNVNSAGQPTLAFLFGTATPLRLLILVSDSNTGEQKVYTSAFESQQGGTDFTAFVR